MKNCLALVALLIPYLLFSQPADNREGFQLRTQHAIDAIKIDGYLDELSWKAADSTESFWLNAPRDDSKATHTTYVRMTYDDKNIFISAVLKGPDRYVIQTLKRDGDPETSDSFGVLIDPIGQKALGYAFSVNAGGAQTEAMVSAIQSIFADPVDRSWDARWYSAIQKTPEGWIVEMAIPFKSIRYKHEKATWAINFWRVDRQSNERHVWAQVPLQFDATNLGFTGSLLWDSPPKLTGLNASVTPYAFESVSKDIVNEKSTATKFQTGADAKIGLSPTLNLDLTVNPNFAQTDVDQQVINLTRFNISFPERRQFFLENSDVFTNFGSYPDAPFFSRRIGLDAAGRQVPINYGARITGNLDANWRIGVMNMQTKAIDSLHPAQNYSAAAIHRRVLKRSSIRAMLLNRQSYSNGLNKEDYGRNASVEFEYLSMDGRWAGRASYNQYFNGVVKNDNRFLLLSGGFNSRKFQTNSEVQRMGTNYNAEMGFLSRLNNYDPTTDKVIPVGYTTFSNISDYSFYPQNKRIIRHWLGTENYLWWTNTDIFNEWYSRVRYFIFFRNTSQLRFRFNDNYVNLLYPFQITDGEPLPAKAYHFREFNIQLNSDLRKKVYLEFFYVYGSYYNGTKGTLRPAITYRAQPWGNFSMGFEYNDIRLPGEYGNAQLLLINPKTEINFSNKLFWTTFFQYNTQSENFNINSRLQWRYRPMSDIFLVYTDNYITEGRLAPRDKAIMLKVNYYFQL